MNVDEEQIDEAVEPAETAPVEEQTEAVAETGQDSGEVEPNEEPRDELQGQLLRLQADFENFRKRTRREKEEWTQRSIERVCEDLLVVLDHFELGMQNAEKNDIQDGILQGFRMVQDQMLNALGKYGLQPIEAEGAVFDPNLHEAVTTMASPEVAADHVMAQTRKGYQLGEKLLRPAQVVVSSGASEEEQV